jgi:hypothetical protein
MSPYGSWYRTTSEKKEDKMSAPSPKKAEAGSKDEVKNAEVEKPKSTLQLLEEDDEFEEFDSATWEEAKSTVEEDKQLWKDDWDDDAADDVSATKFHFFMSFLINIHPSKYSIPVLR